MSGLTRQVAVVALAAGLVAASTVGGAGASTSDSVEVVKAFDGDLGQLPEGVVVDKSGNLYASLGPPFFVGGGYGEVRKFAPDGTETTLWQRPGGPAPAGLAVSASGTVFFAVPDPGGPDVGVYRVTDDGVQRLPGTENMLVPNGLALDKHGNLYASDSVLGAIWRMPADGSAPAESWLSHPVAAACPGTAGIGANGIAFWKGDLLVANTEKGLLARVPIGNDGSPGEAEVVAGDTDCEPTDALYGMDAVALDIHGQVYALLVLQHRLVRINPVSGEITSLLDSSDGLWNGASLAFGTGKGHRQHLFIANYAVLGPEPIGNLGPAILSVDVGVPGLPLP